MPKMKVGLLLQHGVDYAFEGIPGRLPFLKGLSQVCTRLPAAQADMLLSHMEQSLTGHTPQEGDPEWEDYWDFLALAQERASKGAQPRSALKGTPPSHIPSWFFNMAVLPTWTNMHCAVLPFEAGLLANWTDAQHWPD